MNECDDDRKNNYYEDGDDNGYSDDNDDSDDDDVDDSDDYDDSNDDNEVRFAYRRIVLLG